MPYSRLYAPESVGPASTGKRTYTWDAANHLARVDWQDIHHVAHSEAYWYTDEGARIRKQSDGINSFYPIRYYTVVNGVSTRHDYFGNTLVAERTGTASSPITYRFGNQVDSTMLTVQGGNLVQRRYFPYGMPRALAGQGTLPTQRTYSGQVEDSTGLLYMNARYYDPYMGLFISPDPLIPDPTDYFSYNCYFCARANLPVIVVACNTARTYNNTASQSKRNGAATTLSLPFYPAQSPPVCHRLVSDFLLLDHLDAHL